MKLISSILNFFLKPNWCIICGNKDYPWRLKPEAFWVKHKDCEYKEGDNLFFDECK